MYWNTCRSITPTQTITEEMSNIHSFDSELSGFQCHPFSNLNLKSRSRVYSKLRCLSNETCRNLVQRYKRLEKQGSVRKRIYFGHFSSCFELRFVFSTTNPATRGLFKCSSSTPLMDHNWSSTLHPFISFSFVSIFFPVFYQRTIE